MYYLLILAIAGERLAELIISKRHSRWALAQGGVESGRRHYPAMVALHTGLLLGCVLEVWVLRRPFIALLGWTMFALVLASQALRWWCVATLGRRWNTLVIVVPGMPLVQRGPYRYLKHPNYLAVVVEGIALPLVHSAWITSLVFTALNTVILTVRLRVENRALAAADGGGVALAGSGR